MGLHQALSLAAKVLHLIGYLFIPSLSVWAVLVDLKYLLLPPPRQCWLLGGERKWSQIVIYYGLDSSGPSDELGR